MVQLASIIGACGGAVTVRHAGEQHTFTRSAELMAFERMLRGQVVQARRTHWTTRAMWGHFLRSLLAFEPTNSRGKIAELFCLNRKTVSMAIQLADLCVDPASGVIKPADLIQAIKSTAIRRRTQARDAMRRSRAGDGKLEVAAIAASKNRTEPTKYPTVGGGTVVPPDQHAHKARLGDSINPQMGDGTMVPSDQNPDGITVEQLDRMTLNEVEIAAGIRPERVTDRVGRDEPDLSLSPLKTASGSSIHTAAHPGGARSVAEQRDESPAVESRPDGARGQQEQMTLGPLYQQARQVRAAIVRLNDAQLASLIAEGLIGGELLRRLEETPVEPGALGDTPTLAFRGS